MDLVFKIMRGLAHLNIGATLAVAACLTTSGTFDRRSVDVQGSTAFAAIAAQGEQQ